MYNKYYFRVAGLTFAVNLPGHLCIDRLLPSFAPFCCGACADSRLAFCVSVSERPADACSTPAELIGSSTNDMGNVCLWRTASGYRIEIYYGTAANGRHLLDVNKLFSRATVCLRSHDAYAGMALSSMLRIVFAQALAPLGGVSVHASCVSVKGSAYLFLGSSGTGKSTHACRWMEASPYCRLLNDDNPALRIEDGSVVAYGTPWSGKTPCYKNERYPVAGIARLQQSACNRFTPLADTEAFAALLPSCSIIRHDARLNDALCTTLIRIAEMVPVGLMECLPDTEAAWACFEGFTTR